MHGAACAACAARLSVGVGALKQLCHEAQARVPDVRAASEHVEHGIHAAAQERKRRHVGTRHLRRINRPLGVSQQSDHLQTDR